MAASVSVSGGGGAYTYVVGGDFAVGADGLLSLATAQSNVATLTATVVVNDTHDNTAPANAFLTPDDSRAGFIYSGRCHPELDNPRRRRAGDTAPANLLGGLGTRSYALVSTNPSDFDANITVDDGEKSDSGKD